MSATSPEYETFVFVRGRAAADRIAAAAERSRESKGLGGHRRFPDGWWGLRLLCSESPEQAIFEGAEGIVVQVGSGPSWLIGHRTTVGYRAVIVGARHHGPLSASPLDEVLAFLVHVGEDAPRKVSRRTLRNVLRRTDGQSGAPAARSVLRALGFDVDDLGQRLAVLEGAVHDYPGPDLVGLSAVDNWSGRWVFAQGHDFIGLWDMDGPVVPLERWPITKAGRQAADSRRFDLVERPILECTILGGDRRWTRWHSPGTHEVLGALLHWSAKSEMALIQCLDRPRTIILTSAPSARVAQISANKAGWTPGECVPAEPPFDLDYRVALTNLAQAERVATLRMAGNQMGPWAGVPESVPRGFLDTVEWVRSQVSGTRSSAG